VAVEVVALVRQIPELQPQVVQGAILVALQLSQGAAEQAEQ
jgi:hypothetical protein